MTIIPISTTTPTSSLGSTTTSFSVYATGYVDADNQFQSITAGLPIPSQLTAPGYTDEVDTPTGSKSTAATGSSSEVTAAASSGNVDKYAGFGVLLYFSFVGAGICLLAVWL